MSRKSSFLYCCAHTSRFSLLTCLINWQYALPRKVQPNDVLHLKTVRIEMLKPFFTSSVWKWCAVVSSSSFIFPSTTCLIASVTFDGVPVPGVLNKHPVSRNLFKNLWMPSRDMTIPSFASSFLIVGTFIPCLCKWRIRSFLYKVYTIFRTACMLSSEERSREDTVVL